jgi:hypothetical protein
MNPRTYSWYSINGKSQKAPEVMNIIKQNVEISLKDNLSQNPNGKT